MKGSLKSFKIDITMIDFHIAEIKAVLPHHIVNAMDSSGMCFNIMYWVPSGPNVCPQTERAELRKS